MIISEIIKGINRLPNYLYLFCGDDGIHRVILGGYSCRLQDEYTDLNYCERYFSEMQEKYERDNLTENEKIRIATCMHKIQSACDYRHSKLDSIKQQEEYLSNLDAEQLKEIYDQVQMYKVAREYYRDYIHR